MGRPTADEERVSREDSLVIAIFEQIADAVLGMARCVQCLDFDTLANSECLAMAGSLGHLVTVLAANDRNVVALQRLGIAASMVMVANSCQTCVARIVWR